jgi:hypothetical protein
MEVPLALQGTYGSICVYLVPECSKYYRDQCKDMKQQIHTLHTNYVADFSSAA